MTHPTPSAADLVSRARDAQREAADDLARRANALAAMCGPEETAAPESSDIPELMLIVRRYQYMTVICERVEGASWEMIAARLRQDEQRVEVTYGPAVARWVIGDEMPWTPLVPDAAAREARPAAGRTSRD